jgi:hypothetical protein
MDKKTLQLNDPVNFFRLKNNEKEIYIFGDVHNDIKIQKECSDLESFNFDKYLRYFFQKNKKNVDFMLETPKSGFTHYSKLSVNLIYLNKIRKVFSDLQLNNPYYKHLKIHYIDIRLETIIDEPDNITNSINFYNFDYSIIQLERINMLYQEQLNIIEKFKNNENAEINKENILDVVFYKIIVKYNNKKNKKIINEYFDIMCFKRIKHVMTLIAKLILIFKNNKLNEKSTMEHINKDKELFKQYIDYKSNNIKLINKIKKIFNEMVYQIIRIGSSTMDCYFFRRFLDKEYIKNTIVYVGLNHAANYLHFLVKYYNYKIIEFEFIDNISSKQLENIIKKTNSWMDIFKYIVRDEQCIKIKQLFT